MVQDAALKYWLALQQIHGLGPKKLRQIIEKFPDLAALFQLSLKQLIALNFPETIAEKIRKLDWTPVENALHWQDNLTQHIITLKDERYPKTLAQIQNPPLVIFVKGDLSCLQTPQIAIVGSRNPTKTGIEHATAFAKALSEHQITITSGLALGIDAAAHRGALQNQGKTIAVLGTGVDEIYPKSHQKLADAIIENGALISEFFLGTRAKAEHFPRRNRIISGLSVGVLVVEAALKSGSLITANYAAEQGREVFAIPGSIHNPLSKGCHCLIKNGAKLIETIEDIGEELLPTLLASNTDTLTRHNEPQDFLTKKIIESLDFAPVPIDIIIARTGLAATSVIAKVTELEMDGQLTLTPYGYQLHST